MLKTTRWRPDTCECVLEYEWDTDAPEDSRVHTPRHVIQACGFHAADNTGADRIAKVHDKVWGENTGKNKALKELLDNLPKSEKKDLLDQDGNANGEDFKTRPKWFFDAERKLRIEHPVFADAILKAKVKAALINKFPDFVKVD